MAIQRDDDLEGKVSLISGGASGIGQALAVAYARAGAHSVVNYFPGDPHDAQETVSQVESVGGKCIAIAADVRDASDCDALAQAAIDERSEERRVGKEGRCWEFQDRGI